MSSQGAIIALILLLLYRPERESERHREGGRAEDEVIPNSAHPGSLPHYRGTEIKRAMEQGTGGCWEREKKGLLEDWTPCWLDAQIGEWKEKREREKKKR